MTFARRCLLLPLAAIGLCCALPWAGAAAQSLPRPYAIPGPPPPPSPEAKWRYGEALERRDEPPIRILQLLAENEVRSTLRGVQVRPLLQVFCEGGHIGFAVSFERFLISGAYTPTQRVIFQLDEAPMTSTVWQVSAGNRALGRWDQGAPFVARMMEASRLRIEATPWAEPGLIAEFDLSGLREAIARRLSEPGHCAMPEPGPEPPLSLPRRR